MQQTTVDSLRKMKFATVGVSTVLGLAAAAQASPSSSSYTNFTVMHGYFLQDEESTNPSTFDYTQENFGLINRTYEVDEVKQHHNHKEHKDLTQWERFYKQVKYLNEKAADNVEYKVFFFGRHGEGYHNAAQSYYGTPAWNCYWSLLTGNATTSWADADLTPAGVSQALVAHDFWASQIETQKIHLPDSYFVSPLTRTLRTANLTFAGLPFKQEHAAKFVPVVKELIREEISLHTCDHRRSKSYIQALFPEWEIEQGFTEDDELWNGVTGETDEAQDLRSRTALDSFFFLAPKEESKKEDKEKKKHQAPPACMFRTGAVIPVLVKAEKIRQVMPTTTAPWAVSAHCTAPPVTSLASCVCQSSAAPVTTMLS
ncbi:hypothetical protein AOCH_006527 [Aspergillus ochraceoroseus]|uniref:GPI anchored protein n=1 Tax=Aspergillus ochraceoroseus TaxID=138278 RepID=A0A0F8VIE5_9EURO|nr:hypothetical protein AOCH_006527 [Aspergillus ochraceoroseus]